MDFFLKFLILGGKYLTQITAQSIIEAYKRSMRLRQSLSSKFEKSFRMTGHYENVLELYNDNLDEIGRNPQMQMAFISDAHRMEFEEYLKEIEEDGNLRQLQRAADEKMFTRRSSVVEEQFSKIEKDIKNDNLLVKSSEMDKTTNRERSKTPIFNIPRKRSSFVIPKNTIARKSTDLDLETQESKTKILHREWVTRKDRLKLKEDKIEKFKTKQTEKSSTPEESSKDESLTLQEEMLLQEEVGESRRMEEYLNLLLESSYEHEKLTIEEKLIASQKLNKSQDELKLHSLETNDFDKLPNRFQESKITPRELLNMIKPKYTDKLPEDKPKSKELAKILELRKSNRMKHKSDLPSEKNLKEVDEVDKQGRIEPYEFQEKDRISPQIEKSKHLKNEKDDVQEMIRFKNKVEPHNIKAKNNLKPIETDKIVKQENNCMHNEKSRKSIDPGSLQKTTDKYEESNDLENVIERFNEALDIQRNISIKQCSNYKINLEESNSLEEKMFSESSNIQDLATALNERIMLHDQIFTSADTTLKSNEEIKTTAEIGEPSQTLLDMMGTQDKMNQKNMDKNNVSLEEKTIQINQCAKLESVSNFKFNKTLGEKHNEFEDPIKNDTSFLNDTTTCISPRMILDKKKALDAKRRIIEQQKPRQSKSEELGKNSPLIKMMYLKHINAKKENRKTTTISSSEKYEAMKEINLFSENSNDTPCSIFDHCSKPKGIIQLTPMENFNEKFFEEAASVEEKAKSMRITLIPQKDYWNIKDWTEKKEIVKEKPLIQTFEDMKNEMLHQERLLLENDKHFSKLEARMRSMKEEEAVFPIKKQATYRNEWPRLSLSDETLTEDIEPKTEVPFMRKRLLDNWNRFGYAEMCKQKRKIENSDNEVFDKKNDELITRVRRNMLEAEKSASWLMKNIEEFIAFESRLRANEFDKKLLMLDNSGRDLTKASEVFAEFEESLWRKDVNKKIEEVRIEGLRINKNLEAFEDFEKVIDLRVMEQKMKKENTIETPEELLFMEEIKTRNDITHQEFDNFEDTKLLDVKNKEIEISLKKEALRLSINYKAFEELEHLLNSKLIDDGNIKKERILREHELGLVLSYKLLQEKMKKLDDVLPTSRRSCNENFCEDPSLFEIDGFKEDVLKILQIIEENIGEMDEFDVDSLKKVKDYLTWKQKNIARYEELYDMIKEPPVDETKALMIKDEVEAIGKLIKVNDIECKKLVRNLTHKLLKLEMASPRRPKSAELLPLYLESKFKINEEELKEQADLIDANKRAFVEMEENLRVVKIIDNKAITNVNQAHVPMLRNHIINTKIPKSRKDDSRKYTTDMKINSTNLPSCLVKNTNSLLRLDCESNHTISELDLNLQTRFKKYHNYSNVEVKNKDISLGIDKIIKDVQENKNNKLLIQDKGKTGLVLYKSKQNTALMKLSETTKQDPRPKKSDSLDYVMSVASSTTAQRQIIVQKISEEELQEYKKPTRLLSRIFSAAGLNPPLKSSHDLPRLSNLTSELKNINIETPSKSRDKILNQGVRNYSQKPTPKPERDERNNREEDDEMSENIMYAKFLNESISNELKCLIEDSKTEFITIGSETMFKQNRHTSQGREDENYCTDRENEDLVLERPPWENIDIEKQSKVNVEARNDPIDEGKMIKGDVSRRQGLKHSKEDVENVKLDLSEIFGASNTKSQNSSDDSFDIVEHTSITNTMNEDNKEKTTMKEKSLISKSSVSVQEPKEESKNVSLINIRITGNDEEIKKKEAEIKLQKHKNKTRNIDNDEKIRKMEKNEIKVPKEEIRNINEEDVKKEYAFISKSEMQVQESKKEIRKSFSEDISITNKMKVHEEITKIPSNQSNSISNNSSKTETILLHMKDFTSSHSSKTSNDFLKTAQKPSTKIEVKDSSKSKLSKLVKNTISHSKVEPIVKISNNMIHDSKTNPDKKEANINTNQNIVTKALFNVSQDDLSINEIQDIKEDSKIVQASISKLNVDRKETKANSKELKIKSTIPTKNHKNNSNQKVVSKKKVENSLEKNISETKILNPKSKNALVTVSENEIYKSKTNMYSKQAVIKANELQKQDTNLHQKDILVTVSENAIYKSEKPLSAEKNGQMPEINLHEKKGLVTLSENEVQQSDSNSKKALATDNKLQKPEISHQKEASVMVSENEIQKTDINLHTKEALLAGNKVQKHQKEGIKKFEINSQPKKDLSPVAENGSQKLETNEHSRGILNTVFEKEIQKSEINPHPEKALVVKDTKQKPELNETDLVTVSEKKTQTSSEVDLSNEAINKVSENNIQKLEINSKQKQAVVTISEKPEMNLCRRETSTAVSESKIRKPEINPETLVKALGENKPAKSLWNLMGLAVEEKGKELERKLKSKTKNTKGKTCEEVSKNYKENQPISSTAKVAKNTVGSKTNQLISNSTKVEENVLKSKTDQPISLSTSVKEIDSELKENHSIEPSLKVEDSAIESRTNQPFLSTQKVEENKFKSKIPTSISAKTITQTTKQTPEKITFNTKQKNINLFGSHQNDHKQTEKKKSKGKKAKSAEKEDVLLNKQTMTGFNITFEENPSSRKVNQENDKINRAKILEALEQEIHNMNVTSEERIAKALVEKQNKRLLTSESVNVIKEDWLKNQVECSLASENVNVIRNTSTKKVDSLPVDNNVVEDKDSSTIKGKVTLSNNININENLKCNEKDFCKKLKSDDDNQKEVNNLENDCYKLQTKGMDSSDGQKMIGLESEDNLDCTFTNEHKANNSIVKLYQNATVKKLAESVSNNIERNQKVEENQSKNLASRLFQKFIESDPLIPKDHTKQLVSDIGQNRKSKAEISPKIKISSLGQNIKSSSNENMIEVKTLSKKLDFAENSSSKKKGDFYSKNKKTEIGEGKIREKNMEHTATCLNEDKVKGIKCVATSIDEEVIGNSQKNISFSHKSSIKNKASTKTLEALADSSNENKKLEGRVEKKIEFTCADKDEVRNEVINCATTSIYEEVLSKKEVSCFVKDMEGKGETTENYEEVMTENKVNSSTKKELKEKAETIAKSFKEKNLEGPIISLIVPQKLHRKGKHDERESTANDLNKKKEHNQVDSSTKRLEFITPTIEEKMKMRKKIESSNEANEVSIRSSSKDRKNEAALSHEKVDVHKTSTEENKANDVSIKSTFKEKNNEAMANMFDESKVQSVSIKHETTHKEKESKIPSVRKISIVKSCKEFLEAYPIENKANVSNSITDKKLNSTPFNKKFNSLEDKETSGKRISTLNHNNNPEVKNNNHENNVKVSGFIPSIKAAKKNIKLNENNGDVVSEAVAIFYSQNDMTTNGENEDSTIKLKEDKSKAIDDEVIKNNQENNVKVLVNVPKKNLNLKETEDVKLKSLTICSAKNENISNEEIELSTLTLKENNSEIIKNIQENNIKVSKRNPKLKKYNEEIVPAICSLGNESNGEIEASTPTLKKMNSEAIEADVIKNNIKVSGIPLMKVIKEKNLKVSVIQEKVDRISSSNENLFKKALINSVDVTPLLSNQKPTENFKQNEDKPENKKNNLSTLEFMENKVEEIANNNRENCVNSEILSIKDIKKNEEKDLKIPVLTTKEKKIDTVPSPNEKITKDPIPHRLDKKPDILLKKVHRTQTIQKDGVEIITETIEPTPNFHKEKDLANQSSNTQKSTVLSKWGTEEKIKSEADSLIENNSPTKDHQFILETHRQENTENELSFHSPAMTDAADKQEILKNMKQKNKKLQDEDFLKCEEQMAQPSKNEKLQDEDNIHFVEEEAKQKKTKWCDEHKSKESGNGKKTIASVKKDIERMLQQDKLKAMSKLEERTEPSQNEQKILGDTKDCKGDNDTNSNVKDDESKYNKINFNPSDVTSALAKHRDYIEKVKSNLKIIDLEVEDKNQEVEEFINIASSELEGAKVITYTPPITHDHKVEAESIKRKIGMISPIVHEVEVEPVKRKIGMINNLQQVNDYSPIRIFKNSIWNWEGGQRKSISPQQLYGKEALQYTKVKKVKEVATVKQVKKYKYERKEIKSALGKPVTVTYLVEDAGGKAK